ncbi:MAG: DUF3298 and DUF4163 domain-containing protein [Lachnospiraceae bacterium]|nr:DUF3298 and DUF4163 domain-containing protein [Lachnospiraceae bacterium]
MKKKIVCALFACTMLSLSACGQTDKMEKQDVTIEKIPEQETSENVSENSAEVAGNTSTTEQTAEDTTEDTCEFEQSDNIKIEMKTVENTEKDSDGTVLLVKSYTYPIVTIDGNEAAAEKINADIQTRIDSYLADDSISGYAKEDRAMRLDDGDDSFMEYTEDLGFEATRSDSNVISFKTTYYSYAGGAHGNYGSTGINYNTHTGDVIAFSDLSKDAAQFRADTLAYNRKLASTEGYVERLYSPDVALGEELETTLYADNKWYLSTAGLTFISDPYALGPYAAGMIEFTIPYKDLKEMGLKEEYCYAGRTIIKLPDGSSYTLDLNGDRQDDEIKFQSEYTEDEDGNFISDVTLTINGADLSHTDEETIDTFEDYAWAGYTLYDLEKTDDTIELVFYSSDMENEEYIVYSNFYRYGKDGRLTYLGKIKGDVSNPILDTSSLLP